MCDLLCAYSTRLVMAESSSLSVWELNEEACLRMGDDSDSETSAAAEDADFSDLSEYYA